MRRLELVVLVLIAMLATSAAAAAPAPAPATAGTAATAAKPVEPQIYVAWGAPYGMPGAREDLVAACDDTARVDTLYITFDPGQDAPALGGLGATLFFWPQGPDTLGAFWHLSQEGENRGNGSVEFYPPPPGAPSPFTAPGLGSPRYQNNARGGRLDLIYAVPRRQASAVKAGTRYFFAKVILRHRRSGLPGCNRPLCIEVTDAKIAFTRGASTPVTAGQRFASWNAGGAAVCKDHLTRPASEFGAPSLTGEVLGKPREVELKFSDFKPAVPDSAAKK